MSLQTMKRTRGTNHTLARVVYSVTGTRHLLHLNRVARDLIPKGKDGRRRVLIEYGEGAKLRLTPVDESSSEGRLINDRTGQLSIVSMSGLWGWHSGLAWRPRKGPDGKIYCTLIEKD